MVRTRLLITLATAALVAALTLPAAPVGASLPTVTDTESSQSSALAPRNDADWYEAYFFAGDGVTRLHADILRPKGLGLDGDPTPVVLTVSPYTNHNGSTTDVDPLGEGPNPRFYDFLDGIDAFANGYTYVMVDLPGTGGSGGCNDWGGAREQEAVRAAVEWAASQSWSNGSVALLGKSYDGWTGLMGIAQQPRGLAAVVALEPVYSGYRYIYMNGVRRPNYGQTLALFQAIDAKPGRPADSPEYHVTGAPQVWCYGVNMAGHMADDSQTGPYWAERDLLTTTLGRTTPLFLTQGFLETNTRPDGAFQYFNGLAGSENRAWYGQFDHIRGWETDNGGRFHTGRTVFFEELLRFLDEHLKGIEPGVDDPTIAVQDIQGRYRAEEQWPPVDAVLYETDLRAGSYTDSGTGRGLNPTEGQGLWSISAPLEHDAWFAGEPAITVSVEAAPNANLVANVYDINPDGEARMISRGAQLLRGVGVRSFTFTLYGQDWPIPAGHRVGVLLSSANTEEFLHAATRRPVTVRSATVRLPFLTYNRTEFLDGESTPRLEAFLGSSATTLSESFIEGATAAFALPEPMRER